MHRVEVLGSAGGPESASTPLGIVLLLTPSLLLGSSFLVLMASLHQRTAEPRKVWSHLGVAFATVYVVLTGMVYFIQLTLVGPRLARGEIAGLEFLVFTPFDSFLDGRTSMVPAAGRPSGPSLTVAAVPGLQG